MKGFFKGNFNGRTFMLAPKSEGWFSIDTIDIAGITGATLSVGYQKKC
jgi:cytochrome c